MSFASFTLQRFSVCLSTLAHACAMAAALIGGGRSILARCALCRTWVRSITGRGRWLDPSWFERDVELMPSPLAEQSAARLRTAPLSCVPHVPCIPHPCPQSTRPFHVAPRAGPSVRLLHSLQQKRSQPQRHPSPWLCIPPAPTSTTSAHSETSRIHVEQASELEHPALKRLVNMLYMYKIANHFEYVRIRACDLTLEHKSGVSGAKSWCYNLK
jgi:hypothetical protein